MANVEFGSPRFKVPVMNDENTSEVTAVYFAKKVLTPVYENTEEEIIAKKGEDKKKIKTRFITEQKIKKEDLVDYATETTFEKAKGGEKVTITYKKKVRDSISFKKITKAKIKEKVWVVATCNGTTGKLAVEINENKLTNTAAVYDNPVKFLIGGEEKNKIEFEIFKDIIVTPNTYAKEITLQPKSKEDVKALVDKFDKRTDKNAFLFFKAETIDPTYEIKIFEENKEFINKDGERLEILGTPCYCNRNIEVDEMLDIIYNLRDKQKYKSERDAFFNKGGEYISSIRVTSGKLTDNKEKVKLFVNEMNTMFKKFKISTCKRKIHFIGQMYLETISFRYTYESRSEVPSNYKGGVAFQGRGMKQITHDYNYLAYYDYVNTTAYSKIYMKHREGYESVGDCAKNRKKANDLGLDDKFYEDLKTFAKNLSENLFHSFNSAGWFSTVYNSSTISAMDEGLEDGNIEKVTKAINGGLTNIDERKSYTNWTKEFFKYDTECINK
jgi:predicted chitinase